ncbi:MAG: acyl-CoA dehydratase activase [Planctomycetota bacterium]
MTFAGIDIGSVATKVALVSKNSDVLAQEAVTTGSAPRSAAEQVLERAMAAAGISREDIARVVSTGYGRRAIGFGNGIVTEISACARGVRPDGESPDRLVAIDLGGQDTKVILIGREGVEDFAMNDKCAAGTGRFLETIARALNLRVEELGDLSLRAESPVKINSTCAVFAESEVISLLARGITIEDIVAGIHNSIAERIAGMVSGFGAVERVVFCGGGALNAGVRKALESCLGMAVVVPPSPQFVAARGAALLAAAGRY